MCALQVLNTLTGSYIAIATGGMLHMTAELDIRASSPSDLHTHMGVDTVHGKCDVTQTGGCHAFTSRVHLNGSLVAGS